MIQKIPIHCAFTHTIDVKELKPNPKNPNIHPEAQIDLLARIINESGWRAPVTVSGRSGYIVKGHGRYLAAKKLQCKEVPIDVQDYKNEHEENSDMIADNQIAEFSTMDDEKLGDLVKELYASVGNMEALELTGITNKDLEAMLATLAPTEEQPRKETERADTEFESYDETPLRHKCPRCNFEFDV